MIDAKAVVGSHVLRKSLLNLEDQVTLSPKPNSERGQWRPISPQRKRYDGQSLVLSFRK